MNAALFMDGVKVGDVQPLCEPPIDPDIQAQADKIARQFRELPKPGTPADQLTDRDKLALALAVGIPCTLAPGSKPNSVKLVSQVPFAVLDKASGPGYIVYFKDGDDVREVGVKVKS